jgi:hypothetical protein
MTLGYQYYRYTVTNGTFHFNTVLCSGSGTATLIAEDAAALVQSLPVTQTLSLGANNIGNLQACGTSISQFVTYTIDGGAATTFSYPADSVGHSGAGTSGIAYIFGSSMTSNDFINFSFPTNGIAVGSTQLLEIFNCSALNTQTTTSNGNVNITEYGAIGEFIAGNFTATIAAVSGNPPVTTLHTVTCSFRVRRNF